MYSNGEGSRLCDPAPSNFLQVPTVLMCSSPLTRIGLSHVLAGTGFNILAEDGSSLSQFGAHLEVALVLIHLSSRETLESIKPLKTANPEAKIAVLADQIDLDEIVAAFRAGVDGVVLSTSGREILIRCLELVMLGERIFPSEVVLTKFTEISTDVEDPHDVENESAPPKLPSQIGKLSDRELEILSWLKEGAQNKVIARNLDVTEGTIKVHVKAILKKLGAKNRTQAAMIAAPYLP